jgi:hypothetical protein
MVMTLRPAAALALGLFTCAVPLHAAGALDPSDPADALLRNRKMTCSLEDGKPATFRGTFVKDKAWTSGEAPLWYDNPLGGNYQDHVGGAYHAMEFGSTAASAREALDARDTALEDAVISWGRISRWLPWMQMGDRDGVVVFHTAGMRLDAWEQLPEVVRREVEANYPTYRAPPPLDDPRPNETSWTVFKKYIDARRAGEAAKQ